MWVSLRVKEIVFTGCLLLISGYVVAEGYIPPAVAAPPPKVPIDLGAIKPIEVPKLEIDTSGFSQSLKENTEPIIKKAGEDKALAESGKFGDAGACMAIKSKEAVTSATLKSDLAICASVVEAKTVQADAIQCLTDMKTITGACLPCTSPWILTATSIAGAAAAIVPMLDQNAACSKMHGTMQVVTGLTTVYNGYCGLQLSKCSSSCGRLQATLKSVQAIVDSKASATMAGATYYIPCAAALKKAMIPSMSQLKMCTGFKLNLASAAAGLVSMGMSMSKGKQCESATKASSADMGFTIPKACMDNPATPGCDQYWKKVNQWVPKATVQAPAKVGPAYGTDEYGRPLTPPPQQRQVANVAGKTGSGLAVTSTGAKTSLAASGGAPGGFGNSAGGGGSGQGLAAVAKPGSTVAGKGSSGAEVSGATTSAGGSDLGSTTGASSYGSGGGTGSGGTGGLDGAAPLDQATMDEMGKYLPGGSADPSRLPANAPIQVTGAGGKNNFEKMSARYADIAHTLNP